ncbi:dihydroxyacetone kinase subunit DhaL [Testudinibacter sp. TR-2022]|uniref:dihydroxyacetone kinase subunit DhaL n=1 Tax=Testudinibacter sp. TR-2022 TaxID=2585029 RepID=UPI00111B0F26|nr:dihydroxyacetone kinase subunit DhaL [Testudinibacter sp. TR-2022]TNH03552.1 dihydroxyacetone kinase subunit L [Pasteurellaceae bacterium Phil11]TNH19175.1 dihydroxyacetone kinase subunit L [Testudinibacter sp. TR-2022]TNH22191.1 dihydroxyacetone kinase subunit L [Testudinibacter sp. TR-2022]
MERLEIIKSICQVINDNKDYLTELDREIGDGDHGVNLARGFEKIAAELPNMTNLSAAEVLSKMAMLLMSNVGGASGALYASALIKGSAALKTQTTLNAQVVADTWQQMIDGIQQRGKAVLGEKTMLDSQIPAYQAFLAEISQAGSLSQGFAAAEQSALNGLNATRDIIATKGRASYLGERSLGHLDPGAASSYLMIKAISEALAEQATKEKIC